MNKIYQKENKTLIDRTKERRNTLVCTLGVTEALPTVKSLKMQTRQKCSLSLLFLLGGIPATNLMSFASHQQLLGC